MNARASVAAPSRLGQATAWGLAGLAGMLVWTALGNAGHLIGELPPCALRHVFGIGCATCGFARAAVQLAQGELAASWALHPFAMVLALEATLGWAAWGVGLWRPRPAISGRWWGGILATTAAAAVVLWLVRLALGAIPI